MQSRPEGLLQSGARFSQVAVPLPAGASSRVELQRQVVQRILAVRLRQAECSPRVERGPLEARVLRVG